MAAINLPNGRHLPPKPSFLPPKPSEPGEVIYVRPPSTGKEHRNTANPGQSSRPPSSKRKHESHESTTDSALDTPISAPRNASQSDLQQNAGGSSNTPTKKRKRNRKNKALATTEASGDLSTQSNTPDVLNSPPLSPKPNGTTSHKSGSSPQRSSRISSPLFFVDESPSVVVGDKAYTQSNPSNPLQEKDQAPHSVVERDGLLLPNHITLASAEEETEAADQDNQSVISSGDSDIDFIDDDRRGARRYYDLGKPGRQLCTTCGDSSHFAKECPVLYCVTCGAKEEHITRNCPFSLICHNCGGRGHFSRECDVNRRGPRGCERCGSRQHAQNACPTNWRIYDYLSTRSREKELQDRVTRINLDFQQGGEGYVSWGEWCYNCGRVGHWGDECTSRRVRDRPGQSAFSEYNVHSGPFAKDRLSSSAKKLRDASRDQVHIEERDTVFDDGLGFRVEGHVGRKAREAEKKRAAQRQEEIEDREDQDDWFSRQKGFSIKGAAQSTSSNNRQTPRGGKPNEKIVINIRGKYEARDNVSTSTSTQEHRSQRSLLSRIESGSSDSRRGQGSRYNESDRYADRHNRQDQRESSYEKGSRDRYNSRDLYGSSDHHDRHSEQNDRHNGPKNHRGARDRANDRNRRDPSNGPRYHGGYG